MNTKPRVSILCLTFNHEKYIQQALDSFLAQKTKFKFEILINDDCSTDKTIEIIKKYQRLHPNIIKPVFHDKNLYSTGIKGMVQRFLLPKATGEYIALCEGDDYWIDTKKIQKQVDFMDKNKDFSICFTKVKTLKNGKLLNDAHSNVYPKLLGDRTVFSLEDILLENFIATCTVMYRKKDMVSPKSATGLPFGDWTLNTLTAQNGKIKYINEAMAVYRVHQGGVWSSMSPYKREEAVLSFYLYINKYFKNKYADILIERIRDVALYHANSETKLANTNDIPDTSKGTSLKLKRTIKIQAEKIQKQVDDLDYIYDQHNYLKKYIYEVESSFSWKLLLFIRVHVLDKIISNRPATIKKIVSAFKLLKSLTKNLKKNISKYTDYFLAFFSVPISLSTYPKNKPLVSIIIPCYNYGRYIHEAVDSVLKQTFQNFEIIIVESNSTDNSRTVIQAMTDKKIVKLYRNENHLAGDNRNYGISKANGKYVCCLDPDDILKPTYLEKAIFILETQNYDLVSTSIETFGTESKIYYQIPNPTLSDMTQANHVSTVAVFKKHFWKKANGYHDYGTGDNYVYEDWDLWLRISALGARFYNINEPLMLYRLHGSDSLSSNIKNKSREEQKAKIIEYNQQLLGTINILRSKINNKILHYRVVNKYVNLINKTQPVDILFALPFTALGGADKIFLNLINLLKDNGITSLISTTVHFNNSIHDTSSAYEKITSLIFHLPRFLESQSLQKDFIDYLLQVYKVKIIFIGGSQLFYNNLEYIKHRYPQVKIIDIQFNTDIHFKNALKNKKSLDRIIAENQTVHDEFVKAQKFDPKKVDLISYGVETNILKPEKNNKKLPSSIPKNKFIISYIGRLSEEKNPGFMIKLAQKYKNNDKLFFVLAGPGNMFDELQREINSLNLKNIFMPGTISSAEYLSFTDVLVLPSKIDGNPIIIKEAFSMAVPVVASNVGGVPYLVKNNETGFICKIDDIKSFSSSLDKIINSPTLLQKMKKNCRSYAIENLDIESVNKKFLKVFKEELVK